MAKNTSIKLDDDLKGRVQHLAEARTRSARWVMREAILQYVEREEIREAFRQDTLKAWEYYQATGLHATADEANSGWPVGERMMRRRPQDATSDVCAGCYPRPGVTA